MYDTLSGSTDAMLKALMAHQSARVQGMAALLFAKTRKGLQGKAHSYGNRSADLKRKARPTFGGGRPFQFI